MDTNTSQPTAQAAQAAELKTVVQSTNPDSDTDSAHLIKGVSVKALIALLVIGAVVTMSVMKISIVEPLLTLCVAVTAFYFGSDHKKS